MSEPTAFDKDPRCDKCGAPITTAMMAAICPHRERCEFWPDDAESQAFLDSMAWRHKQQEAQPPSK
jgi:hypothetical protein